MLKYFTPLAPAILVSFFLLAIPQFREFTLINLCAHVVLFTLVVCIPAWKTGRLSYVDIGWPIGLAVIGVIVLFVSEGDTVRRIVIGAAYVFIGLRMGVMSIHHWLNGGLDVEYPRYLYQRRRWEKAGKTNTRLAMQVDGIVQGMSNVSFLAIPALVISANPQSEYSAFEFIGLSLWFIAIITEISADRQKHTFIQKMLSQGEKNKVCNVGLWKYSRHPNYFAEWLMWTSLVVAAVPSWFALNAALPLVSWLLLGVALLMVSRLMYVCLVVWTGAVPAEYYSVQKRPDYKAYQQTTNMFFPGPPKKSVDDA